MNLRLTDQHIRATCRDLMASTTRTSGRAVRRELRARFGAVGKTARVFQIWRQEVAAVATVAASAVSIDSAEMQKRLRIAEAAVAENLVRAERAEYRERAHQESWAMEIDRLRAQLRAQPNYAAEIRALQEQVLKLTVELHAAKALISQRELSANP